MSGTPPARPPAVAPFAGDAAHVAERRGLAHVLRMAHELSKARLTGLVVVATAAGYFLGDRGGAMFIDPWRLLATLAGTALVAAAASAFNQAMELRHDRLMVRTSNRPLPRGSITPGVVLVLALIAAAAGLSILCGGANSLAASLALATLVLYLFLYTPLKRVTTLNTVAGAIPGAMPPLIGWSAATGTVGNGAWLLFAILFLWQIPHFLVIAWRHREDYARAGFRMLPASDHTGGRTARLAFLYGLAMTAVSFMAPLAGLGGWIYLFAAFLLGALFLVTLLRFWLRRDDACAYSAFLASILYLPALLAVMTFDPTTIIPAIQ